MVKQNDDQSREVEGREVREEDRGSDMGSY